MPVQNNVSFGKRNQQHAAKITSGGNDKHMVWIKYMDKAGNLSTRKVEPYKLDGNDFWGYDPVKNSIRRFKLKQIKSVKNLNTTYEPRWEVEMNKIAFYKESIYQKAMEKMAGREISEIKNALRTQMERNIATMMATSHEYKKPAVDEALALVKNYKWERGTAKTTDLEGLNKPTILEKVRSIVESMKGQQPKPLITVDKLHGIKPQTKGKRILLDGHHRLKALEYLGRKEVPIYKGTFTGKAQLGKQELRERN